ncbi:hypothetical protein K1W54_08560 [Micromonospora sp. CPCC 205371]|nr:hypothetical protein [Micromonospora sp. CPCC 205371]
MDDDLGPARGLTDGDLAEIEQRLQLALSVAPAPWKPSLETRWGTGGSSAVLLGGDPDDDNELYFDLHLRRTKVASPDERLDAVVDFIGHSAGDVTRLLAEVRRLREAA